MLFRSEHLIGRSATKSIPRKPEDSFTGRIEVRDQSVLIDGEQARGDRLDHRLDVGTAAIEFEIAVTQRDIGLFDLGLTPLQVRRHTVERLDQGADFIRRLGIDPDGEIPLGNG